MSEEILGLNTFHGDSAACLVVDGQLVAAAAEERFRRVKHWAGFPSESVKVCLRAAGIGFVWLIAAILEASVLRTEQVYNVFAFLPLVVTFFVLQSQASRRWQAARAATRSLTALGTVVVLTAFGLHVCGGVRYEEAHIAWQGLRTRWPIAAMGPVAATTSLWGLAGGSEELARFRILNSGRGWDTGELGGSPILIQQMFGSDLLPDRASPPRNLGIPALGIDHVLAVDLFNRKIPRVFGVPLGRSVPGWGFAAYFPRRVGGHLESSIDLAPEDVRTD